MWPISQQSFGARAWTTEPGAVSASSLVGELMNLVREPDAGNPPVRFDEREVETEHGMRLLRHSRGNPETEYVEAYPTAPPLDSTLYFSSTC